MEDKLLRVLRNNKEAFGWTIHDIKEHQLYRQPCLVRTQERRNHNDGEQPGRAHSSKKSNQYRKLNEATQKYHFFLLFIDQMLEKLSGHEYYCYLDGYSSYIKILVTAQDKGKTTFTCIVKGCLLVYAMLLLPFRGV
ncbi:hypothetical protein CR513_12343, partial [Mucuna pruriens]